MESLYYSVYIDEMKDWLFTKNGADYPRYAIGGLHYSSDYSLKTCSQMKVGNVVMINGYALKRVK